MVRSYLKEFEDYLLDQCIEQGSPDIRIPVTEFFELRNTIEGILSGEKTINNFYAELM